MKMFTAAWAKNQERALQKKQGLPLSAGAKNLEFLLLMTKFNHRNVGDERLTSTDMPFILFILTKLHPVSSIRSTEIYILTLTQYNLILSSNHRLFIYYFTTFLSQIKS